MADSITNNTLKRLKSHYRLVILNEDTFEEVVKFKLTRTSVYIFFSSIFVLIMGLTAFLIILTPLKYYLPGVGYGNAQEVRQYKNLKMKADSMEHALKNESVYLENLKNVLSGNIKSRDTTTLKLPNIPQTNE